MNNPLNEFAYTNPMLTYAAKYTQVLVGIVPNDNAVCNTVDCLVDCTVLSTFSRYREYSNQCRVSRRR